MFEGLLFIINIYLVIIAVVLVNAIGKSIIAIIKKEECIIDIEIPTPLYVAQGFNQMFSSFAEKLIDINNKNQF